LFLEELDKIKPILIGNSYPLEVIDTTIKKFLNKKMGQTPKNVSVPKPAVTLSLPYLDDEKVALFESKIKDLVSTYYPQVELRLAYKTPKQIRELFKFKDQISSQLKSYVVYKINCRSCNACYIGKTIRHLRTRIEEHKNGIGSREEEVSSVYKHMLENNHEIDFENVEVLDSATNDYRLRLKEALYIKKYKPALNIQVQSDLFKLITIGN
jgi:hypothetical protein